MLARGQLIEANAKFEGNRVVAQAAGPGAAGGLISLLTAPVALLVDAVSFLASAGLIWSVRAREPRLQPSGGGPGSPLRDLREGGSYVLGHRLLRPLLLAHANANLALGLVWSIVIVYAVREFGLTAGVVGVVLSLGQIGGLAGSPAVSGVGRAVVVGFFLFGPATLLLAVAPEAAAIPFLAFGWALENLARALYGICATSIRQAIVPDRLQARVTGFLGTAGMGAFPVGAAIGGLLASTAGLRQAMLIGALISFAAFVPVALSPVRSLRGLADTQEAATDTDDAQRLEQHRPHDG